MWNPSTVRTRRKGHPVTTISTAQLEAITRLERAAIALQSAHTALQHPDLCLDGITVVAPSGRKHIEQITRLSLRIREAVSPAATHGRAE